jgi:hypothetical protein
MWYYAFVWRHMASLQKLLKGLPALLEAKLSSCSLMISKAALFPEGRQYYAVFIYII